MTGVSDAERKTGAASSIDKDKPLLVLICNEDPNCDLMKKLQDVTFQNEKVALGIKAFQAMRATIDNAREDPALKELIDEDEPVLVLYDLRENESKVLKGKKLSATKLFRSMRKIAKSFYKEDLEKVVKQHLKLLETQDKLAKKDNLLREKDQRLDAKERAGSKGKKLEKERAELTAEVKELKEELAEVWKLTPKEAKA